MLLMLFILITQETLKKKQILEELAFGGVGVCGLGGGVFFI